MRRVVLDSTRQIQDLTRGCARLTDMGLVRDDLVAAGWGPALIEEWMRDAAQLRVEDALRWATLGISAETANWYHPIRPSIVEPWISAGFDVSAMVRCHRSRVTLSRAIEWKDRRRALDETIRWASFGFSPDEADHWTGRGMDPPAAHQIRRLQRGDLTDGLVAFVVGASAEEPFDVPDDARDLAQEVAEMLVHIDDVSALPQPWRAVAERLVGESETEGPGY